jgi:hypothetical protein
MAKNLNRGRSFDGRIHNAHRDAKRKRTQRGRPRPLPTCSEHRRLCAERAQLLACNATATVDALDDRCDPNLAKAFYYIKMMAKNSPPITGPEVAESERRRLKEERLQVEIAMRPMLDAMAALSRKDHAHRRLRNALEKKSVTLSRPLAACLLACLPACPSLPCHPVCVCVRACACVRGYLYLWLRASICLRKFAPSPFGVRVCVD